MVRFIFVSPDLRVACRLGREVLDEAAAAVAVGVTTDELDRIVHEATVERESYPSPLNYYQVGVLEIHKSRFFSHRFSTHP